MAQGYDYAQYERIRTLALWTHKFATLMSAGVNLLRCMDLLLEATEDEPLHTVTGEIKGRLDRGEVLSAMMADHPGLFSRHYVATVRAGEVGGILDEMMCYLADWLEQDLEYMRRFRLYALVHEALRGETRDKLPDVHDIVAKLLEEVQPLVSIELYCKFVGSLLGAGVPLEVTLECAADVLDEEMAGEVGSLAQAFREDRPMHEELANIAVFPPVVRELWRVGEETGQLDRMLLHAADLLHSEIEARVLDSTFAAPEPPRPVVEV